MRDRMSGGIKKAKDAVATGTHKISTSFQEAKNKVGTATTEMGNHIKEFRTKAVTNFQQVKEAVPGMGRAVELLKNPLLIVTAAVTGLVMGLRKLKNAAGEWIEMSSAQHVSETKLAQVMRNTMNATSQQTKEILELANAQQKLGVVSAGVQLAGAQELGTYLGNPDSLKKLLPAMNDMLAQQYGLSATQEQSANIAMMLGKVMQGQTGALSRYGYAFTEAQEKILKTGTEAQRAAVLVDVLSESVGGMNEALAATPEGQMQQLKNTMNDLRAEAGTVALDLKAALLPFFEFLQRGFAKIVSWVKNHSAEIKSVISNVMNVVMTVIRGVYNFLNFLLPFKEVIMGIVGALAAWKVATMAVTVAQWLLNVALTANPIGLVIAAIGALIGFIMLLRNRYEGWGTLFKAVGVTIVSCLKQLLGTWKFIFEDMWYAVKLIWLKLENFAQFMGALFANIGKSMKAALKGNFAEAKEILKQKITTDAEVKIKKVEAQRSGNRQKYEDESLARAKEVVDAWKNVSVTKKVKEKVTPETTPDWDGSGGINPDDNNRNDKPNPDNDKNSADRVAGSAAQVRNITVNITKLGADNINVNSEEFNTMSPSEMEDYFSNMLTRTIRNIEMSY